MIKRNNINHQIRATQVRLIDQEGQNVGVVTLQDALNKALEAGLDLIEMSSGGGIPVCRIADYNKYAYDQKAKLKKTKPKKSDLKEFKFGPNIGEGDLRMRIERGREFIQNGDMVKYTVVFRGREVVYPEIGITKLKIVESELADVGKVENPPRLMDKTMSILLTARKK